MKPNIPRAPVGTLDPVKLNFKDAQVELQRCTNYTQEKPPLLNHTLPSPGSIKCIKLLKSSYQNGCKIIKLPQRRDEDMSPGYHIRGPVVVTNQIKSNHIRSQKQKVLRTIKNQSLTNENHAQKRTYVFPEKNKRKQLSRDTFTEQITKTKTHSSDSKNHLMVCIQQQKNNHRRQQ